MKRAILYARVSGDDNQGATSSIQAQLDACRKYANDKGYKVEGEFFEEPSRHTSGADWLPELDKVVRLAPSQTFDVLVVREMDRLARNRFKQLAVENALGDYGIGIEYAIGNNDDSAEGKLMRGLAAEFAAFERDKIQQRMSGGRLRSVQAGNVTLGGGDAPFGYRGVELDGKRSLEIDPEEAEIVKEIFDRYGAKGLTLGRLCKYLDERYPRRRTNAGGDKRRRGDGWSIPTVKAILKSETYLGKWHFRKTELVKNPKSGKKRSVQRPRDEWITIRVPAIIDQEVFDRAQRQAEVNKRLKGKQHKRFYALGGMIRCGVCGRNVTGIGRVAPNGESEYRRYLCATKNCARPHEEQCNGVSVSADALEDAVWVWIGRMLSSPEQLNKAIAQTVQERKESVKPKLKSIENAEKRMAGLHAQKSRLVTAYTSGVLSLDEIADQKAILDKNIDALSKTINSLRVEVENAGAFRRFEKGMDLDLVDIYLEIFEASESREDQREIYEKFEVKVTLYGEGRQHWCDVSCTLGEKIGTPIYNKPDVLLHCKSQMGGWTPK